MHLHRIEDKNKGDISIQKLVQYNLIFFFPLLFFYFLSILISVKITDFLEASINVVISSLMVVFATITFFYIIPYIRKRENVKGVRQSLFGFLIVGFSMTIPSMINGKFDMLFNNFNYLGSYIMLTFIFCPEVLGINLDLTEWFKERKQVMILYIYSIIVLLYVFGFAWLFFQVYNDPVHPNAFNIPDNINPSYGTFIYFSIITNYCLKKIKSSKII